MLFSLLMPGRSRLAAPRRVWIGEARVAHSKRRCGPPTAPIKACDGVLESLHHSLSGFRLSMGFRGVCATYDAWNRDTQMYHVYTFEKLRSGSSKKNKTIFSSNVNSVVLCLVHIFIQDGSSCCELFGGTFLES